MANVPMQPELRAYPVMHMIPPGHFAIKMDDTSMEPHIYRGECAVIDVGVREIEWGEVHAVMQSTGPVLWQVCRPRGIWANTEEECAMLHPLNRPRRTRGEGGKVELDWSRPVHMSDGPMYLRALRDRIIGRVVGVFNGHLPPMGSARQIGRTGEDGRDEA